MSGRELDLHRLELRFAATRIAEPQAVQRIEHQLSAVVSWFLVSW